MTITGRHVSITETVKNYASEKLTHMIDKHALDRITKVHIIMDVQKYQQVVEVELHGPHADMCSKVASSDMYASIDKVVDKIERQLIKHKDRYNKRKHVGAQSIRIRGIEEEE